MKGKVNCTCGWSWNKSDSSKKDMYICHECGRDNSNNMKNGGWLDSYADGGTMQEHQENYNNSQASAPEGMVGDGFSNVGRNYSPAWGGQFQLGGNVYPVNYVPQAQEGTGNISAYKEQDYLDRGWDILSNPLTSFGYVARNEEIPDYLDRGLQSGQIKRNALENTLDLVNPIYYLNSAGRGAKDLITGDAKGFIGEAFNFIPALKTTQKVGKIAKNSNKLKTFINTIGDVDAFLHATTGKDLISEGKEAQKKELEKIKKKQMGGSLPGATGHMYARTKGIPSEGPYAKKTMPSAQNGGWLDGYKEGGIIKDDRGQWDHPGEITEIGSNQITMEGVPYDVLGVSDTGDTKLMKPGKNYKFKGKKVTEFPMAKNGLRQEQKGLQNLDNLTNFTNYNKPQPGSWLEKYN